MKKRQNKKGNQPKSVILTGCLITGARVCKNGKIIFTALPQYKKK